jgi:CheY-like chemotaxis protein
MSLILAIEPNKNQAQQLNALVRAHLKAELVTAPTAAAALAALGDRIPDVVLTPALFGLKDEAALTERLRQLGSEASHVQTLAIPILAASTKGASGTLVNRKGNKGDGEVGCDPSVFAEQIKIYLQRAAVERRAQASEAAARAMAAGPTAATSVSASDDLSSFMVSADELDVDSLELTTILPLPDPDPVPAPPLVKPAEPVRKAAKPAAPAPPSAVETELGLVTPPASGPPLWKVTESVEDFYGKGAQEAAGISTPEMTVEPFVTAPVTKAAAAATKAAPSASKAAGVPPPPPRKRRTPPQPDDWTYFDPSQSACKALIRRLDEIAGSAA